MSDRLDEFGSTAVAVVGFDAEPAELAVRRAHLGVSFPFLADIDRRVYSLFELRRGSLREVWNPGSLRMYVDLVRRGRRLQRLTQDTRQLGGDFVISPEGNVVAAFRPSSPDARPSVEQLLAAVHS